MMFVEISYAAYALRALLHLEQKFLWLLSVERIGTPDGTTRNTSALVDGTHWQVTNSLVEQQSSEAERSVFSERDSDRYSQ